MTVKASQCMDSAAAAAGPASLLPLQSLLWASFVGTPAWPLLLLLLLAMPAVALVALLPCGGFSSSCRTAQAAASPPLRPGLLLLVVSVLACCCCAACCAAPIRPVMLVKREPAAVGASLCWCSRASRPDSIWATWACRSCKGVRQRTGVCVSRFNNLQKKQQHKKHHHSGQAEEGALPAGSPKNPPCACSRARGVGRVFCCWGRFDCCCCVGSTFFYSYLSRCNLAVAVSDVL